MKKENKKLNEDLDNSNRRIIELESHSKSKENEIKKLKEDKPTIDKLKKFISVSKEV